MLGLREIEERLLQGNAIRGNELQMLHDLVYDDGHVSRDKADSLVELYKRVRNRTPEFRLFFYNAIKAHILNDGRIDAEETIWLRQLVCHDGKIEDEESQFLNRLKGEAGAACSEFEELYRDCMKQPMERRTSGRKE